jgi:hypothetical protein
MLSSAPVFNKNKVTPTATSVPQAGGENHIPSAGKAADWSTKKDDEFVQGCGSGQQQTLVNSADENLTAQEQIVIISRGNQVSIEAATAIALKAATQITLEVGGSTLSMKKDGTIELKGKDINTNCTTITCKASGQHTIKGGRVDIN